MPDKAEGSNMAVAMIVGVIVGLVAGAAGFLIAKPWGFEIAGLVIGLCVGDILGLVLYQRLRKSL